MAQANDVIWQPKGDATAHKEGTVLVQNSKAVGTGWYGANNINNSFVSDVPATGLIYSKYNTAFTGCAPCS
jgi:hypothetical protein